MEPLWRGSQKKIWKFFEGVIVRSYPAFRESTRVPIRSLRPIINRLTISRNIPGSERRSRKRCTVSIWAPT